MTLKVQGLEKHFDGVRAVRGISFAVEPGECVALIGPNGAGKSTSFACIAGQQRASAGTVRWNGERIDRLTPAQRLQRGIARTFQVAQTFDALSVLHNVQLLTQLPRGMAAFDRLADADSAQAMALLQQVGLAALAHSDARSLPYGAKKRLELAMALAGLTGTAGAAPVPGLLLLDEPAAGLSADERVELMQLVKSLTQPQGARAGLAVLYTEHNMDAVFGVADRVMVLIDGEIAAHGTPGEVARDTTVRQRYLGKWWSASLLGSDPDGADNPASTEQHDA